MAETGGRYGPGRSENFVEKMNNLFKSCEDSQGSLASYGDVWLEAMVQRLCDRYGIWIIPYFQVSIGFRRVMGAVGNASIYFRRSRGLQILICFAMRVNITIGQKKEPHLGV